MSKKEKKQPAYKGKALAKIEPKEGEVIPPMAFYAIRRQVVSKTTLSNDTEIQVAFVTDNIEALEIGEDSAETLYLVIVKRV